MSPPDAGNPYASSATVARDDVAAAPGGGGAQWLAVVASLFAFQLFSGAGFLVLGRRRAFAIWSAIGLGATGLAVMSARLALPRLFFATAALTMVVWLVSVFAVAFAKPGIAAPRTARAVVLVVSMIAGARGLAVATKRLLVTAYATPSGSMMPSLFVLGDNRGSSSDSRAWWSLPLVNVSGRATFIYFSMGKAGEAQQGIRWSRIGARL